MSTILEITQLNNGDIVLRDTLEDSEPILRICFSDEVRDMLGDELAAVAEAMIDAAAEFLVEEPMPQPEQPASPPVIH